MTDKVLNLIETRRKVKRHVECYRQINREIKQKLRMAKVNCEEMEELNKNLNSFKPHNRAKEIAGLHRNEHLLMATTNALLDEPFKKSRTLEKIGT